MLWAISRVAAPSFAANREKSLQPHVDPLAANGVVYGTIYEGGKATLIGAPPPAVAAELEKLWKTEWRQQR
jgi:hypothetical protein